MEALVWLAIPFVVTVFAAALLHVRASRAQEASRDEAAQRRTLARIERALNANATTDGRQDSVTWTTAEGHAALRGSAVAGPRPREGDLETDPGSAGGGS